MCTTHVLIIIFDIKEYTIFQINISNNYADYNNSKFYGHAKNTENMQWKWHIYIIVTSIKLLLRKISQRLGASKRMFKEIKFHLFQSFWVSFMGILQFHGLIFYTDQTRFRTNEHISSQNTCHYELWELLFHRIVDPIFIEETFNHSIAHFRYEIKSNKIIVQIIIQKKLSKWFNNYAEHNNFYVTYVFLPTTKNF